MSLSSILVPNAGCLFGGYAGDTCDPTTSFQTRFRNHETQIQRTTATNLLNIVHAYHDWNDFTAVFPNADESSLAGEGRLLLINWTPRIYGTTTIFQWADIAAGAYDATYVDPTARAMRDWGKRFFLAFHSEPNSGSTAQGGTYGTDAEYASAAQHVHDRFLAQGATNVVWVFNPSGYTTLFPTRMNALYPGDAYVDWIGYDPYSGGATGSWEDVDYVLTTKYPMYTWATSTKSGSHTKPLMWVEWGAEEAGGVPGGGAYPNSKAGYFDQVFGKPGSGDAGIKTNFPLVKAIVYFNSTSSTGDCVNTSSPALVAYRNLAADPYFNPDLSATPPPPPGTGAFAASQSVSFSNTTSKQIVIPAAVQAGMGMLLGHASTRAELRNAAEGGNGVTVTTGNSNGAGSNPWDAISGAAPTYDTGTPLDGTSSMHAAVTAGTTSAGRWTTSFPWPGAGGSYKGRLLYRYPSNPSAICRIYQQGTAAASPQWGIGIDTNGKLIIRDLAAGATRGTSTATPATATKHRVEWESAWNGSTTTVTMKLFLGANWNGVTPDETVVSTAFTQAAAPGAGTFGVQFTANNTYDVHLDQMALDASVYPGLVGSSAVLTSPPGWTEVIPTGTQLIAAGAGDLSTKLFRRTAVAGDPGSTVTLTTDVPAHGGIELVVYSGVDPLALVDVAAASTKSADSTTVVTPNVATTGAGEWILSMAFTRDNPGGLTTSWSVGSETQRAASFPSGTADGRVAGLVTDDAVAHAAGTYGTKTLISDKTSYLGVGWTVALKPAATGGGDTQSAGYCGIPT